MKNKKTVKKKTYQKMLGLGPAEMQEIEMLQKRWAKLTGLAVKKTDVMRMLFLIVRSTHKNKIQAILSKSRDWYK